MEFQGIRVLESVLNVDNPIDPQEAGRDATSAPNDRAETAGKIIRDYLFDKVPEFRRLSEYRKKVGTTDCRTSARFHSLRLFLNPCSQGRASLYWSIIPGPCLRFW